MKVQSPVAAIDGCSAVPFRVLDPRVDAGRGVAAMDDGGNAGYAGVVAGSSDGGRHYLGLVIPPSAIVILVPER